MAGYAAFGTVVRGQVSAPGAAWPSDGDVDDRQLGAGSPVIEEAAGRTAASARTRLRDRLAIAREQWSITTFYLFDPNSWR